VVSWARAVVALTSTKALAASANPTRRATLTEARPRRLTVPGPAREGRPEAG
jgi:hypothetical protein